MTQRTTTVEVLQKDAANSNNTTANSPSPFRRGASSENIKPVPRKVPPYVFKGHAYIVHEKPKTDFLESNKRQMSYQGLFNLAGLVLFVTNFRLILENLLKYGLLFGSYFVRFSLTSWIQWPCLVGVVGLNVYILSSFAIEKTLAKRALLLHSSKETKKALPETTFALISGLNIGAVLIVPTLLGVLAQSDPIFTFALLFLSIILFMKLISYHLVNREYRDELLYPGSTLINAGHSGVTVAEDKGRRYPANLTFGNFAYFLVAPTLCYQLEYPRTQRVNWSRVGGLALQWIFVTTLQLFLLEQYLVPTVVNSIEPFNKMQYVRIIERLLKLSIPNLYIWLLMFYGFFHLWLTLVAEVLRFGDQEFYKDWWNSTTLGDYWRTWNIPVHVWLVRHVYYPLRRLGFGTLSASFVIFALSGLGHEILVSIPCHTFQLYVFVSFMTQIPLMYITKTYLEGTMWGNLLFWFFFCILGQPMCILIYAHLVVNHYRTPYWLFW